ncbi:MAG: class I SAM-dependent methyltransferase [Bacteroidetes bacterium]|nr:class I SAM-dependent methyltransferase [Bacteroidota bacterium]
MKHYSECPICSKASFKGVREPYYFRGEREYFNVDECQNCGFWLTNPAPEGEELAAYYQSDDYVSHTDGKGGLMDRVYGFVRGKAIKSKFELVRSLLGNSTMLVDYGAGTGEFLKHAKNNGFDVLGFEPSEVARENAAKKDLKLLDPANRQDLAESSVGVFTLWHVLEHIPDLNETLHYFHSRLVDSGYLVLALPNHESYDANYYKSDWAALDAPLHLWHFAKNDIQALANKHGFELREIRNMPFDSFYVSLLSEKNKHAKQRPLQALLRGLASNMKGAGRVKNMSSLIYVLQKKV